MGGLRLGGRGGRQGLVVGIGDEWRGGKQTISCGGDEWRGGGGNRQFPAVGMIGG